MEDMIRVQGLAKRYDDFALEDVTFSVPAGTVVGLVGSNGAGKTTILKTILGLATPDAGSVRLLGCDPNAHEPGNGVDKVKARVGVVLDTCAFPMVSRVADVGTLGRAAYSLWDESRFEALCDEFDLGQKKAVKDLSRGMGMKLTLAFALSHDPELLILDEATAGLDPMARDEVLDILRRFMEDESHAILFSSHITSDLEKIADEVICIEAGRMIFDMPKDAICDEAGIAHCRAADVERLAGSEFADGFYALHRAMSTDLLVPHRFDFARAFPDIPVDRISIEDYMALMLKGEPIGQSPRLQDTSKGAQR